MSTKKAPPNNPAAALARKRWAKTTPEQRSQTARDLNAARWNKSKKKATAAPTARGPKRPSAS